VDIPVKLPAPEDGTDEQAGPKSVIVALADWPDAAADAAAAAGVGAWDAWDAAEVVPLELHAAVLATRPTAAKDAKDSAKMRYFTGILLISTVCEKGCRSSWDPFGTRQEPDWPPIKFLPRPIRRPRGAEWGTWTHGPHPDHG
jgi:hypothetical protein